MAIDIAEKRRACAGIPLAFSPGITSTILKDQDWRFESAGSYIGYVYEINTAEKRKALSGIPLPLAPGVTPDVWHGRRWRYQAGHNTLILTGNPAYRVDIGEYRKTDVTERLGVDKV